MADPLEREARKYLRLFPEWMREVRGEEAVGLVLDQVPAGASSLPWRSKADLVRAGLHARRRGTPPWRVRQQVAQARSANWNGRGAAVPLAWRPWLITMLRRRSFPWRCAFRIDPNDLYSVIILSALYVGDAGGAILWWAPLTFVALIVLRGIWFLVFGHRRWRARLAATNGLDPVGRPLPPNELAVVWVKPTMPNRLVGAYARGALVGALVGGPVAWRVLAPPADHHPPVPAHPASWSLAVVAVALVAGWCAANLLLGRVDEGRGAVDGPNVPGGPHGERWVTVASGLILGGVLGFAGGLVGRIAWLDPFVLAAAPLGVAVAVLGFRRYERRLGRPLGVWDICPDTAPQRVVRRLDDLPSPPPPDLPAPS